MRAMFPLLLLTATSSALAQPLREANAVSTVTGPSTDQQHNTDPTLDQTAVSANFVSFSFGGSSRGNARATATRKAVTAAAHGLAQNGGGISYNSAWSTSTNTLLLASPSLEPNEFATVFFSVSYHGQIAGSVLANGDVSWFDAMVSCGVVCGDVNDGVYGEFSNFDGFPDTPPFDGTVAYQTSWQNGRTLVVTLSISMEADCFAQYLGSDASADGDYSAGIAWLGVQRVVNSAGIEITDYTLTDQDGRDWRTGTRPTCTADFNGDGNVGTDADIAAFFACLGGDCCPACGSADFNNDGNLGTDADIESFFRVLGGGPC